MKPVHTKMLVLTVTGLLFIGFNLYKILCPYPITAAQSISANYLLFDLLLTLGSGVIGIVCLFMLTGETKRKTRKAIAQKMGERFY